MVDAGLTVIVALISPFRANRDAARGRVAVGEFIEAFVDTPIAVAEARDVKGLYRRAREGAVPLFTGVSSNYEPPPAPELVVHTEQCSAEQCAALCLQRLGEA
jgi:bifunctional enzyme CysN/CysC